MKKLNLFTALFFLIVFTSFAFIEEDKTEIKAAEQMPDNIKAIIDKSCFDCHNSDSRNEDAKEDLDFKTFDKLSKIKKIGALKHIGETVEEGEMPPKRFLERFPDKKLTDEEIKSIIDWVEKESLTLIKQ